MQEPMNRQEVIALMQTSRDDKEWNQNADEVKKRCYGYPSFWYEAIVLSGIMNRVQQGWMSTAVKGNLVALTPEQTGGFRSVELLPPNEAEIAEIREQQKRKGN